ncbi:porin family protein [Kordia sp. YSTF-M3]|uniref:Porin family protein n=1 Tax=Kordia aestuariivivens TaxID=2759037 RepID=A0ABR7Q883_9FLAO|nr:OmpW family outer membrane protein [Kordia aestuariivivens]MBC8754781.1 porin family protein [Kordia aestuariivivens]
MKKLLLFVAIAFLSYTVNAQTEKGKWVISGSTSISYATTNLTLEFDGEEISDDTKGSIFSLTPSVGYFVINNLAVGLDLSFASANNDNGTTDVTTSSFSSILGGTYYFEAGDKFKPFVGLGAGLISTSSGDDDSLKSNGLALRGKGGLAYFVNQSLSIDFSVLYLNTNQKNKENSDLVSKNSSIAVGLGFSLFL